MTTRGGGGNDRTKNAIIIVGMVVLLIFIHYYDYYNTTTYCSRHVYQLSVSDFYYSVCVSAEFQLVELMHGWEFPARLQRRRCLMSACIIALASQAPRNGTPCTLYAMPWMECNRYDPFVLLCEGRQRISVSELLLVLVASAVVRCQVSSTALDGSSASKTQRCAVFHLMNHQVRAYIRTANRTKYGAHVWWL